MPPLHCFWLAALLFLFALGNHQLQGSTEARVAGIAIATLSKGVFDLATWR
ncbi:hypothetical protein [Pseudomonas sp. ZS1P83]